MFVGLLGKVSLDMTVGDLISLKPTFALTSRDPRLKAGLIIELKESAIGVYWPYIGELEWWHSKTLETINEK